MAIKDTLIGLLETIHAAEHALKDLALADPQKEPVFFTAYRKTINSIRAICYHGNVIEHEIKHAIPVVKQGDFQQALFKLVDKNSYSKNDSPGMLNDLIAVKQFIKEAVSKDRLGGGRVFYSWQSDLPNNTNRGFIQESLNIALGGMTGETLTLDSDTRDTAGVPDIGPTILKKIDGADIFVADVSLTMNTENRCSPNPNVLFELGYALARLGPERIIMLFNSAYGETRDLPFDLGFKKQMIYRSDKADTERAGARKELAGRLRSAIQTIVDKHK